MTSSIARPLTSLACLGIFATLLTACPADPAPGTSSETETSTGDGDGDPATGDGDGDDPTGDGDGDDPTGDGDGDNPTGDGDGDDPTGDGDGDDPTGDGDGDPGDEACDMCIFTTCADPLLACEADPLCTCWLDCDGDDQACAEQCGASNELVEDVGICLNTAAIGSCSEECITDPCDACVFETCGTAFEECIGDSVCWCQFDCDGDDVECQEACGPENQNHGALLECLLSTEDSCAEACA